jgi:hypothetical protein
VSARRTVVVAVTAWLAVVAVGSALVWAVISRAGEELTTTSGPRVSAVGDPTPGATHSPERTHSPTDGSSASPESQPGTLDAVPQRRTWQGTGGYVVVVCTGPTISLAAAQPDAGFRVEVDERGPVEVRVEFEEQVEEERKSEVRGTCVDGLPVLQVDSDD